MTTFSNIPLPSSPDINVRIAWAGDIFQDLIEGLYTTEQGWYIHTLIAGWTDLCTAEERRQYLGMLRIFDDYLLNNQ